MTIKITRSELETKKIAEKLALSLEAPAFVCLKGDLGSGKTVFVKGFARAMGLKKQKIKSPTYTYVRHYKIKDRHLFHFDFYRIEALDELMEHDLQEIFAKKNAFFIIEWPERIVAVIPKNAIYINFLYLSPNLRKISLP
jgi:tRNA threonylcarbamoyladenosine biosynthesis protein TsaE